MQREWGCWGTLQPDCRGGRGFIKAGGKGRLFVKCETSSQGDSEKTAQAAVWPTFFCVDWKMDGLSMTTARTGVLPGEVRFDCVGPVFYEIRNVHLPRWMTRFVSKTRNRKP